MPIQQMFLGAGPGGTPDGQENFITAAGTFSWVCPAEVTSVSVACIGGGGGGGGGPNPQIGGTFNGGGGGACAYKNSISVSPGTSYTVVVGVGWHNCNPNTGDGGDSYFINTSTVMAKGGQAASGSGRQGGQSSSCVGDGAYSGGDGGQPAFGPSSGQGSGTSNAGGGSGGTTGTGNHRGTGGAAASNGQFIGAGGGGGGSNFSAFGGGGGGGGNIGTVSGTNAQAGRGAFVNWYGGYGGYWGGGGGATGVSGSGPYPIYAGGRGAVRIIWSTSGIARAFPGTNIGDL